MAGVQTEAASFVFRVQENFDSGDDFGSKWILLQELKSRLENSNDIEPSSYCAILNKLLDSVTVHLFEEKCQEQLYDEIFLITFYHDTFLVLVQQLTASEPSYKQTKILKLLEKYIHRGNMLNMFMEQCYSSDPTQFKYIPSSRLWDELITCIITLPDRVANKTKGNLKKVFTPICYVAMIRSTLFKVLGAVCEKLKEDQDCSVEFLGKIIGRLCNSGHGLILVEKLVVQLIEACSSDFIMRRVCQNLICKIPASCIESFIAHLLTCIPWYGYVGWLLGDAILSHQKVCYLMTVKFLFVRQFKENIIPQNIVGYLANSKSRYVLFLKVLESLLDIWANRSTFKYQNFSQQYYLGSFLMIYCGFLKDKDVIPKKHHFLQRALDGATLRLSSSDLLVRHLGMMVGESLASALDPSTEKLNFEQQFSPKLLKLRELMIVPIQPSLKEFITSFEIDDPVFVREETAKRETAVKVETSPVSTVDADNDDDDDLEPYDLSNDQDVLKRPLYIRDCMNGLRETDKAEWVEQCLRSAESLIRSSVTKEIAVEMVKILLHLDNAFAISDFDTSRYKAMVAVTVKCPAAVAEYLSSQFYERDYNIRQRLDMLEVLAGASCELSQPTHKEKTESVASTMTLAKSTEATWQEVVQRRLEAKTRRYNQGPRKPLPDPELNVFGTVAGYFFFPLMEKFDKENFKCLNLLQEDSYVLGRLLHTLGVVMHSASNTLIAKHMGSTLLQFVSAVKISEDPFVRRSAIFAMMAVILSVPPHALLTDLQEEVLQSRIWLEEVMQKDLDIECQTQAAKVIELLIYIAQGELPSIFRTLELSSN